MIKSKFKKNLNDKDLFDIERDKRFTTIKLGNWFIWFDYIKTIMFATYFLFATISTVHLYDLFVLGNTIWLAISLCIAVEGAAMISFYYKLNRKISGFDWVFMLLVCLQLFGNVFSVYTEIETTSFGKFGEFMYINDWDLVSQKRLYALLTGAPVPLIVIGLLYKIEGSTKPILETVKAPEIIEPDEIISIEPIGEIKIKEEKENKVEIIEKVIDEKVNNEIIKPNLDNSEEDIKEQQKIVFNPVNKEKQNKVFDNILPNFLHLQKEDEEIKEEKKEEKIKPKVKSKIKPFSVKVKSSRKPKNNISKEDDIVSEQDENKDKEEEMLEEILDVDLDNLVQDDIKANKRKTISERTIKAN